MAADANASEKGYNQWRYTIYLVAFPNPPRCSETEDTVVPVADMISHLVPEARVVACHIFHGGTTLLSPDLYNEDEDGPMENQEDSRSEGADMRSAAGERTRMSTLDDMHERDTPDGSDVDMTEPDSTRPHAIKYPFSPAWIEEEALILLGKIQKNALAEKTADRSKVLLAGHGLGGIVVKKAVIIANTLPEYYDVSLSISSLVFMATPHHLDDRLTWEDVLWEMIKATKTSHYGRLSHVLSRLVDSVSQLSHVFYSFATKYPMTNFVEGKGFSNYGPVVGEMGKFNNNSEKVVSWPEKDFNSLMFCAVDDFDKLESIRTHFAPGHLLNRAIPGHLSRASQVAIGDSYLEALQSLSPSRWIICETKTLDKPDDFSELREVYRSLLSGITWKEIHTMGSIQITGPAGYGKSALVKFISHQIRQRSSIIVIDNLLSSSKRRSPSLYGVYVSFLHQIISQRPSLFLPIQNLMVEMSRLETWTEESPWILLSAVFQHSRALDFLVVIYDFEDWPREIRSWWSETLCSFVKSCGSTCTFLTSSHCLTNDLTPVLPYEIDLKNEYERHKKDFIRAKTKSLLNDADGSNIIRRGPSDIIKKIMSAAEEFQGSFTAIDTYLVLLFQAFILNPLDAIVSDIESSPQTEEELYELVIGALWTKSNKIRSWASSVLSWILWSVRPLRIEELGSIAAVKLDDSSVSQLRPMVPTDIERDLRSHLGLIVAIENGYPRVKSALARNILIKDDKWKLRGMQNDSDLTKLCLHYLTLVLKDKKPETWEKCLSQVSWKHQAPGPRDRALDFLDYACRFWPTHFLLVKEPDSSLKDKVVQFLLAPNIGEKWFQLYLLCISQTANPLLGDQQTPRPATAVSEPALTMSEQASFAADDTIIDSPDKIANRRRLAVRMASFVGLASIIPVVLGSSVPIESFRTMNVRRGYTERAVVFLDTGSQHYLDCTICNDDDRVVKELLESNPARTVEYFPLHKAVQGGCLKTARKLFNLLDSPAQTDLDGRTPLHLAAIGGSTKILRFLLGKDVSDTHQRRIDVPNMLDVQDGNSQTPLIIASRMGNIKATKILIESGADFAIRDGAGKTALHYAVLNCPEAVEDFMIRDSAQVRDNDDCELLHTAASSGSVQTASVLASAFNTSREPFEALNARDRQDWTPVYHAAENGHTDIVELLLKYKRSTESEDEDYQQAAELAAARGHLATVKLFMSAVKTTSGYEVLEAASRAGQLLVVEYLLRNELASPDGHPSYGRPISSAASTGYNEVVRTLLRYNAAVNIEDATRRTPLHHAAENGRYHVAQTLLKKGASVTAPDLQRNTPLHSAAKAGQVDIIVLLKKYKADTEEYSLTKKTPLHLAVKSPKAVEALLNANADRTATNMMGRTPLHLATRAKCYESADLLRWPADMDAKDDDGKPPLYYAISQQDLTMVKLLCKDRPSLRDSQDQMRFALKWAVQYSALDVLAFLLNISSVSVNKLDRYGYGIVHEAAEKESLEVLILLLESGADVNLPDRWKRTPLHEASREGRVQNMQKLLGKGAEVNEVDGNEKTPLHMAIECNEFEAVTVLLEAKVVINIQDDSQQTPLYSASNLGRIQIVERLLEKNADVKLVDNKGWSPLHAAADNLELTRMLIAHGADVDLQDKDLWTPLQLAVSWAEAAVAELLIEKGANPNQVTSSGRTALHLAIMKCDANLVQLMLNKGADSKIKTRDGLSCLSLAVDENSSKHLEVLLGIGTFSASGVVWDSEDMVAAYWRAIGCNFSKPLTVLVKEEGRLLDEISEHGFTGLETCLRTRRKGCEEEPMAICLLELGADPFKRREADQESAFELGIISRGKVKLDFMDACLERVSEDLSSAATGLGFKELRIAAELDESALWKKLEPLRDAVSAATDNDGWSLDHFIHQSAGRIRAQSKAKMPLQPTRTPTGLTVLPMWLPPDMDLESRMEIVPSRLEVHFASAGDGRDHQSPICLRADFPFPLRDSGLVYFELTISPTEHTAESKPPAPNVSLGFCGEFSDLKAAYAGWYMWSVGYHGDDGCIYEEYSKPARDIGLRFGIASTVGCGIDYASEQYFFTRDGKIVARCRSRKIISRKLYPVVSHDAGACTVKVNFGEDNFVWPGANKEKESDMGLLELHTLRKY